MKECTKCKKTKNKIEFHKDISRKGGRYPSCKECTYKYGKTKDGLIAKIYSNQRSHSKSRGHLMPTYSKKELREWLFSQPKFHILFDNWKRLDCQIAYVPSVDRKNNHIGYTMHNIRLVTWKDNKEKGHADMRSGKLKHGSKPQKAVIQFSLDGEFVSEFVSASDAARKVKVSQSNISACCLGKPRYGTVGGYRWEFKSKEAK